MRYPITVTPDDNGTFLVTCPLLPEVTSFGDDEADATVHALDAVMTVFGSRIADRQAIPLPKDRVEAPFVVLSPLDVLKIELHNAMVKDGIRKADLGRRLNVHPTQVDRLLDFDHTSRLDQMENALSALGRMIEVRVRAA